MAEVSSLSGKRDSMPLDVTYQRTISALRRAEIELLRVKHLAGLALDRGRKS